MANTKKISKNIPKRKWEGNKNVTLENSQLNANQSSNRGNEEQSSVRYTENSKMRELIPASSEIILNVNEINFPKGSSCQNRYVSKRLTLYLLIAGVVVIFIKIIVAMRCCISLIRRKV